MKGKSTLIKLSFVGAKDLDRHAGEFAKKIYHAIGKRGITTRKRKPMKEPKFNMNDVLQDRVSGFKGEVLGITFYDTGCIHYGLAGTTLKPDGSLHDWQWFDESRLKLVKAARNAEAKSPRSGPDMNPRMY